MPVELQDAVALRKALKQYNPELAKETQKEIARNLRKVISRARGFVPSGSPLSGWGNQTGIWASKERGFNATLIKRGITYSTTPSMPNDRGFRTLAAIFNKSAAGAIYETAGRLNPQGQPAAQRVQKYRNGRFITEWQSDREVNKSANPNAARQFINALPPLVDSQQSNSAGRRTRKTKGRLMFRAWAEDQGKTTAAVVKAIQSANMTVVKKSTARGEVAFRGRPR
jgi:hypothetical protein